MTETKPSLINKIKEIRQRELSKHTPAKDAEILTPEDEESIEAFKIEFDKSYLDESKNAPRRIESDGFHPSSLGTDHGLKCGRYHVHMLRGAEKQNVFSAQTLRILETGTETHERIQKRLADMGVLISAEIPIDYEYPPIKGHADGMLKWRDEPILLEIKTIGMKGFEYRQQYKTPKAAHFLQANLYAHILEVEKQWYLYWNKNNDAIDIFQRRTDHEGAQKIINQWKSWYQDFEDNLLPKRYGKNKNSPVCSGCPLRDYCWNDLNG